MTLKRIILTFLMAMTLSGAFAETTFTVKPPRGVYEGDKFPITFKLTDGHSNNIKVQPITGCTLLYGPSTSTSQSYQIINGKASSSSTVEFTYFYRAGEAGTYTIPAATVVVDGKQMSTKQMTFTVMPRADRDKPASQRPVTIDDPDTQAAGRQVNANDVFVRIILSRPSAYEQEAIACTIKLYTKYSISSFMPTKQPNFDGFLIQEVDLQPSLNEIETYNGQEYMTALLKKCIIFPQQSGKLTINSGNYDISVVQYDNVNMGLFQVRQPREAKIKVSSNSASINILPLPTPQPDGFFGAVGRFSIDSKLVGNSFRTNDPATLIYTISGTGNIKYVKEPVIDFPSEFEQYTPKSDIQAEVQGNDVTGSMTVEYTFVPQSVGDFTIGSDKFVYFDPSTKQYVTLTTPSYNLKVAKGVSTPSTTEKKDIEAKNTDIRHIHQGDKGLARNHKPTVLKTYYWILYAILIIGLIAAIYIYGRNARLHADITGRRQSKANKIARKRLKAAAGFMNAGDADKFYEEMLRAVWGYLSDKLSIPVSQLSRDNIVSRLSEKGYPAEVTDSLIAVLDECEMARYTPDSSSQVDRVYNQGVEAINRMENCKLN